MADDIPQDQNQTAPEETQPVPPTDQPPVETPPAQPTTEMPPEIPQPEIKPAETKTETLPETPTPTKPQPEQNPVAPSEAQIPVSPPVLNIPTLHYPFSGNFSVTFAFGEQATNEEIKKKFTEWGIVGHNGLDFGLSAGNEVFACNSGKIIQSGVNGDFGTSVTIQHSWGQSIYGHLQESKVKEGDEIQVNKVIGLSGSSGAAFGEHLHFAIKPNSPDFNNGYLGFIDPSPYLSLPSQKEETKPPESVTQPETVQEQPKPEETQTPPVEEVPPSIKLEPKKPTEQPQQPQPQEPEKVIINKAPVVDQTEVQRQVDEKLKTELDLRRQKANQARQTKREENLMRIEKLVEQKKQINNDDVRELLHVSQSTATEYLQTLVNRGTIKSGGQGKATVYHY